jgi:four helix bundle protein
MAVKHYKELIAWQKAMDFVELIYRAAQRFPKEEMFGLTSQVRRASVSVPSNIAEGQGRRTTNEFGHFPSVARDSLQEAETQILLAERLGYLDGACGGGLLDAGNEVSRLINGLMNALAFP